MDFPAPATLSPSRFPRAGLAVAGVALAAYTWLLATFVGAVAGGSDSSGYLNHARLLASGHVHVAARVLPTLPQDQAPYYLYVPLGFRPAFDGHGLVPTYPAGLPLFIVALEPLAGWRHAGDLAIILHSLAGLVATYLLGRAFGLGRLGAALATTMLGLSPLYLFMSLQAMSDVPSLVWTALAILAALRARQSAPWALAAGAALAVDVLLRPANVLAFLPAALALGPGLRRWALLVLGGLPGAVFFGLHSRAAYGRIATTGYGDSTFAFQLHYIPGTLLHYAVWLPVLLSPLALLILGLPFLRRDPPRLRGILLAWMLAYGAFYCSYANTHEAWWYLRFLLPAAPAVVIGAVLVLRALAERFAPAPWRARAVGAFAAGALLVLANTAAWNRRLHPLIIGEEERRYGTIATWMDQHLPGDAICLAFQDSGALFYYTRFTFLRWDQIKPADTGQVDAAVRRSGRPLYAVLFPFELNDEGALRRSLPGHWTPVGQVEDVTVLRRDADAATP